MAVIFLSTGVLLGLAWIAYQLRYARVNLTGPVAADERSDEVFDQGRDLAFDVPELARRGRLGPVRSVTSADGGTTMLIRLVDGTRVRLAGLGSGAVRVVRALVTHPPGRLHLARAAVDRSGGCVRLLFTAGPLRYRVQATRIELVLAPMTAGELRQLARQRRAGRWA